MADNKKDEIVLPAETAKPAWLQEVEDEARYITLKRIKENEEEKAREAERKARQDGKN